MDNRLLLKDFGVVIKELNNGELPPSEDEFKAHVRDRAVSFIERNGILCDDIEQFADEHVFITDPVIEQGVYINQYMFILPDDPDVEAKRDVFSRVQIIWRKYQNGLFGFLLMMPGSSDVLKYGFA